MRKPSDHVVLLEYMLTKTFLTWKFNKFTISEINFDEPKFDQLLVELCFESLYIV